MLWSFVTVSNGPAEMGAAHTVAAREETSYRNLGKFAMHRACHNRGMLTASDKQTCIETAEFVLTEIERFIKLFEASANFKETFGQGHQALGEFTAHIKHAESGREYICGREALRGFKKIARIALETHANVEDFDESEVVERLRNTFLSFVLEDLQRPLDAYIEQWIEMSVRYVRVRHRARTHYLPCVALQIGRKDTYDFGPVTFMRKSVFRAQAEESFRKYEAARSRLSNRVRRNAAEGLQWCWERSDGLKAKSPEDTFAEFTHGVDWVAKIRVPKCAAAVSGIRAESALRATLASVTLLLQGSEGADLRLGQDPFFPRRTSKLASIGAGVFRPSSSMKFGAPNVDEEWQNYLAAQAEPILAVIAHMVQEILDGAEFSFGFQIALRAITWYADAVRDPNVETKLIKCATAIECLIFPEKGKATATFVIRGSLLAQRQGQSISHWAPIAESLYKRRSDVAHGNVESLREARKEPFHSTLEFTRNVILQFLLFCRQIQPLGQNRVGTKQDFLTLYRQLEGAYHDDIAAIVKQHGWSWDLAPKRSLP